MECDEYDLHVTNNHHISPVAYKITKLSILPIQILNYCQRIGASAKVPQLRWANLHRVNRTFTAPTVEASA